MSSPFDFTLIDDLVHVRGRLAIMTFLASVDEADFKATLDAIGATEGNLSAHVQKLEAAGYVTVKKSFVGRRPNTRLRLTEKGRDALVAHIDHLDAVFARVRAATGETD